MDFWMKDHQIKCSFKSINISAKQLNFHSLIFFQVIKLVENLLNICHLFQLHKMSNIHLCYRYKYCLISTLLPLYMAVNVSQLHYDHRLCRHVWHHSGFHLLSPQHIHCQSPWISVILIININIIEFDINKNVKLLIQLLFNVLCVLKQCIHIQKPNYL